MRERVRKTFREGDPFLWLTAAALATSLVLVGALLVLVFRHGLAMFWPAEVVLFRTKDGRGWLGEVWEKRENPPRVRLKVGNRDVYGTDFRWVELGEVESVLRPRDAAVFERREWGNLYGFLEEVRHGDRSLARGPAAWAVLRRKLEEARKAREHISELERGEMARIHARLEKSRRLGKEAEGFEARAEDIRRELEALRRAASLDRAVIRLASGERVDVPVFEIVRVYRPNGAGLTTKLGWYARKLWEFLSSDPREANTEGGVFPAIFGTVLMVLLMTLAVVPFGVVAALYLHEYARRGWFVSAVRIAVNNLAGVPSIVFGVFGLGFFVYTLGGTIDGLFFRDRLPSPTYGTGGILWASLTLALLTLPVVVVATEEGLAAVPRELREGSLALGATQFETVWRVVLPHALPGVLTGVILAMARAAGEVAPLMLTGVVKLAPELPLDSEWPFLHLERKFMHLGFHIYDVGFQSPNVEAAKPMVYATTALLVALVFVLNLSAMWLRARLRRRLASSAV